jgi:hypothetical protein
MKRANLYYATCFIYLLARSIASPGYEQRETKVLFGVMSLFSAVGTAQYQSPVWGSVVGYEQFHAGKTTTDRLIAAPAHGLVRSLRYPRLPRVACGAFQRSDARTPLTNSRSSIPDLERFSQILGHHGHSLLVLIKSGTTSVTHAKRSWGDPAERTLGQDPGNSLTYIKHGE